MSPRTAKYVDAMIREGDNFDYDEWLKRVREEDTPAKQLVATRASDELGAAQINKPISSSTSDRQHDRPISPLRLIPKTIRLSKSLRPHRRTESQTPKARLRRRLEKVRRAWGEFQASRKRDAVYGYLEAVFGIVEHYKVRRRTTRLLRHASEFTNLPLDKQANAFAAVIRCTSDRDIDSKTVSKWSRALRYVARFKKPETALETFMKEAGGVNACADRYARMLGSPGR
jgi:hypothetical protein